MTDVAQTDAPSTAVEELPLELTDDEKALKGWLDAEKEWLNRFDPDWEHERFEYMGDSIACRKPSMQAMSAYQLSSSKYVDPSKQNDIVGLFVNSHIGPESYDHIMARSMDPDDEGYTSRALIDIMGALVRMSIADIKEKAAAEKEAAQKKLDAAPK